ncbi:MAG: glycolate oxidase subunit GlcD [Candidatus Sumerlaeia bacterium]
MDSLTLNRLREAIGPENVLTGQADLITHGYDGTATFDALPEAVLTPRSTEHVSAVLRLANDRRFGVIPRGSGTGLAGGTVPMPGCVVLVMNRMNRILEIDEENLTVTAEAGAITLDITKAVEARGLFYPPDPSSMKISTIGGNVANNSGGLRGLKYGVTKDYVMGAEFVLPSGEVLALGNKCVKDVAGYNLKQFLVSSEGTLGVFTKVMLRLIPKPQTKKTMVAYFEKLEDAGRTVSAIIAARIIPCTIEFLDQPTMRCVEDFAHIGLDPSYEAMLLIECDGRPAVVEEEIQAVRALCESNHAQAISMAATEEDGLRLSEARRTAFSALARLKPTTILEDATVPRSQIAPMLRAIQDIARKYNLQIATFGHAGDGNLHPTITTDERDRDEMQRVHKAIEEIFQKAHELGGTITGEHGTGLAKKDIFRRLTPAPYLDVMRRIKRALDPNNIMNPGKVIDLEPEP